MKFGSALVVGLLMGSVLGAVTLLNPPPPAANVSDSQKQQVAAATPPLRKWYSTYDGVKVVCFQSGEARGFTTSPTYQQMENGAVIITNSNPSDDAWSMACGQ